MNSMSSLDENMLPSDQRQPFDKPSVDYSKRVESSNTRADTNGDQDESTDR